MTDFLDDERRRLAYADRSPTLEQRDRQLLPDGHLGECVLTIDDGWRCAVGCRDAQLAAAERSAERQLADGTGRHSRKEMEQATADREVDAAFRRVDAGVVPVKAAPIEFTGLRCDAHEDGVQCTAQIAGDTSSRDALKRLHLKAERYNWQVLWVDGHSAHWCERHRDVDRESVRRLK